MHPAFKHHMDQRKNGESVRIRISVLEKTELESTVAVEGGDITELLIEGIWRVIARRKNSSDQATSPLPVRPEQPKDEAVNFRLDETEATTLGTIASTEGRSITDLVGEGIWHVINDRKEDQNYQIGATRILALLSELEIARAGLHSQT